MSSVLSLVGRRLALLFITCALSAVAPAATLTWDPADPANGTAINAGSGSWDTTAGNLAWNNAGANVPWSQTSPTVPLHAAIFAGADGDHTISLGTSIAANALTFNSSGYTLSATTAQTIRLAGTLAVAPDKTATIGANVSLTRTTTLSTDVSGGGTLRVEGPGARLLGNANIVNILGATAVILGVDGALITSSQVVVGTTSGGTLRVEGGSVDLSSGSTTGNLVLANNTSGNVSAELRIAAGAVLNRSIGGGLRFGSATGGSGSSTAAVSLDGGTLEVARVYEGGGSGNTQSSSFRFNGGTLKVRAGSVHGANFLAGLDQAIVQTGGARIDTNDVATTIAQPLLGDPASPGGGLAKLGGGTLTLAGSNTFTGPLVVSAGTLALAASGTLSADAGVSLAPTTVFDVSAFPAYLWGANSSLAATGSAAGPAVLRAGGGVDLGARPVALGFAPISFNGDATRPALHIASGALTLSGPVTVANQAATPLDAGVYTLVTQAAGTLAGAPTLSGPVGGAGLLPGRVGSLQINGSALDLVVVNTYATTTSLVRRAGTGTTTTYGTPLQFDVGVSPAASTGTVELRLGGSTGRLLATATLSGGTAILATSDTALPVGAHDTLVAVYLGAPGRDPSVSPALVPAQTITAKTLTVTGAAGMNKFHDGNTLGAFTGALAGLETDDAVALVPTATFASAAVGDGIALAAEATLAGPDAANYVLTQPVGLSASILAAGAWTGAAGTGVWDTAGNWSTAAVPAGSGAAATFAGLDLVADTTVHLAAPRTIGHLVFGDLAPGTPAGWILDDDNTAANVLTLAGTAPSITVQTLGAGKNVTLAAAVAGSAGLVKAGPGSLALTGVNTYTGGTFVNAGTLAVASTGALGTGAVTVGETATSTLEITGGTFAFGANSLNVGRGSTRAHVGTVRQSGGAVSFTSGNALLVGIGSGGVAGTGVYELSGGSLAGFASTSRGVILGANSNSAAVFRLSGAGVLSLGSGTLQVGRSDFASTGCSADYEQTGGAATVGTLSLGGGSAATGTTATFTVTGGSFTATGFPTLVGAVSSRADLTLGGSALVTLPAFPARTGAATLTLDFTTGSLTPAASSSAYLSGLTGAFLTANGANLNIVSGRDVTIAQAFTNAPGHLGALRKTGAGNLRLTGANTHSGPTTVEAGILVLNSPGSLAGPVVVKSGGQLIGSGAIAGPVLIEDGGTLNPSNSVMVTLTLGSSLTLSTDATTQLRADRAASPRACRVAASGPIIFGGTLKVVQAGAEFQLGDQLDLFDASAFSGAFTSVRLPALPYGRVWDTSQLAVTGTVAVVAQPNPPITTISLNPATTYQEMYGLGGNFCQGDQFVLHNKNYYANVFAPEGLNLAFIRLAQAWEHTEPNFANFDASNLPVIQTFRAMRPDGRVMLTAWSPPPSLKSTNSAFRGTLAKTNQGAYRYADYGAWWGRALAYYRDNNALPDYVSIQNEADFAPTPPSAQTPDQYAAYLAGNYLDSTESSTKAGYPQALAAVRSAFAGLGLGSMPMIGPDTTALGTNRVKSYFDQLPAGSLQAVAHHLYQDDASNTGASKLDALAAQFPSTPKFMTEMNPGDDAPAGQPALMGLPRTIHNVFARGNHNTYMVWSTVYGIIRADNGLPWNEDYYTLGQYSRFINPGDRRIGVASSNAEVWATAYRRAVAPGLPDQYTAVLLNTGATFRYPTVATSALFAAEPARRAWRLVVTGDDGSTARRLTTIENLSGLALSGDRSFVLPPYSVATVVINTSAAPDALESWRIQHFNTGADAGDAADLADPDADGEANLYEFATGQAPHAHTRAAPTVAYVATPGPTLQLTYLRSKSALSLGLTFTAEWTDVLETGIWSTNGVTTSVLTDNGTLQTVRASVPFPVGGKRFLRLRVVAPGP